MRPLVLLALLAPALAGCLGSGQQTLVPSADPLAGLAAEGAEVLRDGDALTFAWEGTLQPSVESGFIGAGTPRDAPEFRFQVGPGLGSIEVDLTGAAAMLLTVRDEHGAPTCGAGAVGGARCALPGPPGLAGPVTWTATVQAEEDPEVPFPYVVAATLSTPFTLTATLRAGTPAALGDPLAGTAQAARFALAALGPGGEPTVGATQSGALFSVAGTRVLRSTDDGATWDDVTPPWDPGITFDPFLYVDQRTGRVLVSHLLIACSSLWWSDDEGASWTAGTAGCTDPVQDHQKLAVGDHPGPAAVYDGTLYYSESKIWATVAEVNRTAIVVSRSLDGGLTWTPHVAYAGENEHRGQGNLLADTAGNVYVTFPNRAPLGAADTRLAISNDHGVTWRDVVAIPGLGPGGAVIDPDVAIDAAGNVYVVTEGADGTVWMAASRDQGATFGAPFAASPPGLSNGPFVASIAGDQGKVAVAFLATPDWQGNPNDAPSWVRYHLYVTFFEDALAPQPQGTTVLVTPPDDPVQLGAICTRGIACPGQGEQRNLLDFIDAALLPDGRVVVSYTDGCLEGCATAADSRDSEVVVAVQRDGPRLLAGTVEADAPAKGPRPTPSA